MMRAGVLSCLKAKDGPWRRHKPRRKKGESVKPNGPTSRIYFSQRLRLHYVDWGNPDAPPLILVHGGRDHCRNWDRLAQALRHDWHILAPDLRGHGDSQWSPDGSYSIGRLYL